MKIKVNIISINPITVIPIIRYLVDFFIKNLNSHVELTEVHVKNLNNYFNSIEGFSFNNIVEYNNYKEFKSQATKSKLNKYKKICKRIVPILKSKQKQLIYTADYQVVFFILLFQKIYKQRKVVTVYHQFELIEKDKLNRLNLFFYSSVLKNINKLDLVIFPEVNRLNYFTNESGLNMDKAFILPNTCNVAKSNKQIQKHTLFNQFPTGSFIITHLGSVGGLQHFFSNFIEAAEKLENNKNIVFLFLGRKDESISKFIENKKLTNVFFIDSIPHQELQQVYPFIDLGVILYKGTGLNYEYCAPNKLYELWANGVPVIGHTLKGLSPLFNNSEKGVLVDFDNSDNIVDAIIKLKELQKKDKSLLQNLFNDELSINSYLIELQGKLQELLN
ncbi:MAG: glycosyltransferase [Vicingaceae bacterium]|nr:glycosyltransferase [Vicingaceae bacterium]